MRKLQGKPKIIRWLIIVGAILLALTLVAMAAIPPLMISGMVQGPIHFSTVHAAEDFGLTAETLTLRTQDELDLRAWEVRPQDCEAVLIFLSGIHAPSVTAFYGHAAALLEHGFASVLLEMRAHAPSEGEQIGLGYREIIDVQAAVDYILSEDTYRDLPIVVLGLSMGAATAINAAAHIPEIAGVISLSAYASFAHTFTDNMEAMGFPKAYTTLQRPFVHFYLGTLYGLANIQNTPLHNIGKLGERPILLMHSSQDSQIPVASYERLRQKALPAAEFWLKDGDHHFMLQSDDFLDPQNDPDYFERILDFLTRRIL